MDPSTENGSMARSTFTMASVAVMEEKIAAAAIRSLVIVGPGILYWRVQSSAVMREQQDGLDSAHHLHGQLACKALLHHLLEDSLKQQYCACMSCIQCMIPKYVILHMSYMACR
jgi:hypothetical protein